MQCNVGTTDRILRVIMGIGIIGAGFYFQNWWGAIGIVPLVTATLRWCPAYLPFGLNTSKEQTLIADTPKPPYYAVIFSSILGKDDTGYVEMAQEMMKLAKQQPGFLGVESARVELGITVSYWRDIESIKQWKTHSKHQVAQKLGKDKWYPAFKTRIARVEYDSGSHDQLTLSAHSYFGMGIGFYF